MNFNPNMKTKHPVFAEIKQKFNKILELHRNPPQKLKQPKIANASIKKILSMYIPKENLENRTKFNS